MEVLYCDLCGSRVTEDDVSRGRAVRVGAACFCRKCARKMGHQPAAAPQAEQKRPTKHGTKRAGVQPAVTPAAEQPPAGSRAPVVIVLALVAVASVGFLLLQIAFFASGRKPPINVGAIRFTAADTSQPPPPAQPVKPPESISEPPPPQPPAAEPVEPEPAAPPETTPAPTDTSGTETVVKPPAVIPDTPAAPEPPAVPPDETNLPDKRAAYLAARSEYEAALSKRQYAAARDVLTDLLEDPAYAPVAELLRADLGDFALLDEFVERVRSNLAAAAGQTMKIAGMNAKIIRVEGNDVTARTQTAETKQSLNALGPDDLLTFYEQRPHDERARAAACRGAFMLAEGCWEQARWLLGKMEMTDEYAAQFQKRLKLLER